MARKPLFLMSVILILALLLAACAPSGAEQAAAGEEGASEEAAAPAGDETTTGEPAVGGNLVIRLAAEPDTFDPQIQTGGRIFAVIQNVGASLVAKDPDSGEYVPYLAESWDISDDGLTWEFKLREDVKFHNGDPMTAEDYVYTINRALDPATQSPATATIFRGVESVEAPDEYTLRINMAQPNFPLLENLTDPVFTLPLSPRQIEEEGADFGQAPVSIGPFKFKEWISGEKVVLERNPDFVWGPGFTNGVPPYIETLEFRFIPEYSTALAGLEAGEIDFLVLDPKDVKRVEADEEYRVFSSLLAGADPMIHLNVSKPPFDDVKVRQAFNMAVDRDLILKVVGLDKGVVQQGPISSSVHGYWPGVEEIGYDYDVEAARALLEEAGYTLNDDGIYEKDGEPLSLTLKVVATKAHHTRLAQFLQEQLKDLGVEITIEELDEGIMASQLAPGDYTMAIDDWFWPDSSLMFGLYHSAMLGALNQSQVNDSDLDAILGAMMFATSAEDNAAAAQAAQQYIVEQAYIIPFYTRANYAALSSKVNGAVYSPILGDLLLYDAYIETE